MRIRYHPRFRRSYERLPLSVKQSAEAKEVIFRKNPFDHRLRTHKLHGKLKNLWSFSVDRKNRIVFEFADSEIIFLDIGDHDIYR